MASSATVRRIVPWPLDLFELRLSPVQCDGLDGCGMSFPQFRSRCVVLFVRQLLRFLQFPLPDQRFTQHAPRASSVYS